MSRFGAALAALVVLTSAPAWAQSGIPGSAPAAAPAAGAPAPAGADAAAQPQGPSTLGFIVPIAAMGLFFWLFIIRPQNKQMKEHKALLDSLKVGDQVVMQSGFFGKVAGFDEENQAVLVEIAKDTRVKVLKSQVGKKVVEAAAGKSATDAKPQPAK